MTLLIVLLLLVHVCVCLVLWLCIKRGILKGLARQGYLLPFMLCIPLWGPLCVVVLGLLRAPRGGSRPLPTMEKLRVNEEFHQSIIAPNSGDERTTVPLEEALIVNDIASRRKLILSILNENPRGYLEMLRQARLNEDTEVAHYAATGISQISKEADLELQQYEAAYAANQNDPQLLADYSDYLEEYLDAGVVQGVSEQIQRNQLVRLLKRRVQEAGGLAGFPLQGEGAGSLGTTYATAQSASAPGKDTTYLDPQKARAALSDPQNMQLLCRLAKAQLAVRDYDAANTTIETVVRMWPQRQEGWLLRLQSDASCMDATGLQKTLQRIGESRAYFNAEGREALRFWSPALAQRFCGGEVQVNA